MEIDKNISRGWLTLCDMANLMLACEVPHYVAPFNISLDKAIATRDISNVLIPTSSA